MTAGAHWNESEPFADPVTGRSVRRITSRGAINHTPTYHTNGAFTDDGRSFVLATIRDGATWVVRADVATGELTALWRAPGIGDRSYIHRGMSLGWPGLDGGGLCGNRLTIAPRRRLAIAACGRAIHAVHLDTTAHHVVLDDCGEDWIFGAPAVSPDEQWVAVCLSSAHPQLRAGQQATRDYRSYHDHRLRVVRVPIGGGPAETLYEHAPAQSAHCAYSPADSNLLYFDLDLPPKYWAGGDGETPRIWLLDVSAASARPLKQTYPGPFQVHQAWLWDGSALAYHGPLPGGGVYIGAARPDGSTVFENPHPEARYYGHLTPDPRHNALILDGDFAGDLLQRYHYGQQPPRLEPLCRHATEWEVPPGQYSHPHPVTDPGGRWVAWTASRDGRTDVFAATLDTA